MNHVLRGIVLGSAAVGALLVPSRAAAQARPAAKAGAPAPRQDATRPAGPAAEIAAEIAAAEQQVLAAMLTRDKARLEQLLAPQFALVSALSSGEVIDKADWIAGLLERRVPDDGRLEPPQVRLHAPGVATAVVRVVWGPTGGAPESFVVTDTWVRRGRTWQLAARHSSARRSAP